MCGGGIRHGGTFLNRAALASLHRVLRVSHCIFCKIGRAQEGTPHSCRFAKDGTSFYMKNKTHKVFKLVRPNRPLQSVLKEHTSEEMQEVEDEINYGNHPGDEWVEAFHYQSKLEDERIGAMDGAFAPNPGRIHEIFSVLEKLRENSAFMRHEFSIADQHPATLLLGTNTRPCLKT